MTETTRRVAVVADAGFYVGPELARLLAARATTSCSATRPRARRRARAAGAAVEVVAGVRNLARPSGADARRRGAGPLRPHRRGRRLLRPDRRRPVHASRRSTTCAPS